MGDETVRVPAALVEALREKMNHYDWADALVAARALVDAAERPDEGDNQ